jgi:hypothetical protein
MDINAKLRALLPHNAVDPSDYSQHETVSLAGRMEPTPPPSVLAETKYIFEETGGGDRVKMWVTGTHREGPLLICDGWMLRFPPNAMPSHNVVLAGGNPTGTLPPIAQDHASVTCSERALIPFAPSAVPSP